jgi:hypothetical protein
LFAGNYQPARTPAAPIRINSHQGNMPYDYGNFSGGFERALIRHSRLQRDMVEAIAAAHRAVRRSRMVSSSWS